MGYDLHITRKSSWADEDGPAIAEEEWRQVVTDDPELAIDTTTKCGDWLFASWEGDAGSLAYTGVEIRSKYPSDALIKKMVAIAERLGATVQGDDGEIYREDGTSFQPELSTQPPAQPRLFARVASWLRHRRDVRESQDAAPAFRAGQRVKNPWGELGTVLSVDRKANGGLGSVRVRLDDGRERDLAYVTSGWEIVGDAAGG